MASGHYGAVLQHVNRLFGRGTVSGLTEWQLLHRYVSQRDEAAFQAIVARHGPMVLAVCRRVLDDPHDVEDAFQATFLVLVKKAGSLGERDLLGHWLYGVAFRVALRARSVGLRRKARERPGAEVAARQPAPDVDPTDDDLRRVLDQELARLPETYRRPVVLCYLEGLTHEEAARQLAWPVGTVKGRLARARDLLRQRLGRRGFALPAGLLVATLTRDAAAGVPVALVDSTVRAAMQLAAGQTAAAGAASAAALALTEGVLRTMSLSRLKVATALLVPLGVLASGAGVWAYQNAGGPGPQAEAKAAPDPPGRSPSPGLEALARFDSDASASTLAEQRVRAAGGFLDRARADYEAGRITIDRYIAMSRRLLDARRDLSDRPSDQLAALEEYRDRLKAIVNREKDELSHGRGNESDLAEAEYGHLEAALWVAQAKENKLAPTRKGPIAAQDPRSLAILAKLEEPIAFEFADETPLEDVVAYIKEKTKSAEMPNGLPVYLDPVGLQEAEKTPQSRVTLSVGTVPLRTALGLILDQLDLTYKVKDGILKITGTSGNPGTALTELQERATRGELSAAELRELIEQIKMIKIVEALDLVGRNDSKDAIEQLKEIQEVESNLNRPGGRSR